MIDEARDAKIKELLCRHKIPQSARQEAYTALADLYDDLAAQFDRTFDFWRENHIAPLEEQNLLLKSQVEAERKLANYLFEQVIELQMEV